MLRNAKITKHQTPFGWRFRLHHTGEFKAAFAARRYPAVHTSLFSVYRCDNRRGHPRLGIAISRKFARKAIDRNRIKRRIRETFRQQPALPPMDFIVACATRRNRGKASFAGVSSEEIRRQLLHIWTRISSGQ